MELCNSRVSQVTLDADRVYVYFSVVYVHKSKGRPGRDAGSVWTQEAELTMDSAILSTPSPVLPNAIAEGFLEVGGVKHELLPLPFKRRSEAKLCVRFTDGTEFEIAGCRPLLEMLGTPTLIDEAE